MHSLEIVQWNSTRRDHPGNPRGVSGSGPVRYRESYEPGRGNQSSCDINLEEESVICIFLCFG